MNNYDLFRDYIKKSVEEFRKLEKKERIRIISHLDCDGICACSILINILNKENIKYSVSIIQQIDERILREVVKEHYNIFFFTDLGSSHIVTIKNILGRKKVFIMDHHGINNNTVNDAENIVHINPHLFGIDGDKEISGAGVVYLFAKELNNKDMAHIAVIGAIGDMQENGDFLKLNKEILEDAISQNKIKVKRGLRIFGAQTRPLHKVLEYCTDPYIPGVTGSESGAMQFLQQIGINPMNEKGWKKFVHLNEEEIKKLTTAIIMKRLSEKKPEDVLGNVYILTEEKKESPLREAKEFSTLLNSCGRMGKASFGIGACLGNENIKKKAIENLNEYKREIIKAMQWYNDKNNSHYIIKEKGFIIINAMEKIMPTIIGTMASIIAKSNELKDGTLILSLAQNLDNTTKVSLRIAGNNNDVDLKSIIEEIILKVKEGIAGGHCNAAGAVIPTEKEEEFIEIAKEVLSKKALEEEIREN
jgi:RecJ-like exonuclease